MKNIPKNSLRGISGASRTITKRPVRSFKNALSPLPKLPSETWIEIFKLLPPKKLKETAQVSTGAASIYNSVLINRFKPTTPNTQLVKEHDSKLIYKLLLSNKAQSKLKNPKHPFSILCDITLKGLVQPGYYPLNAARLLSNRSAKYPKFTIKDLISIGFKFEIPKNNENNGDLIKKILDTEISQEHGAFIYNNLPDLIKKKQNYDLNAFLKIPPEYVSLNNHGIIFAYNDKQQEVIENMLKSGMFLEQKNGQGYTPLQFACLMNKLDLTRFLAKSGANVNEHEPNMLYYAIKSNNFAIAETLLKFGANLEQSNAFGETTIDYLKKNMEKKDPQGHTKLDYAFAANFFTLVNLLLAYGAEQMQKEGVKKTPMDYLKQNIENKDAQGRTKLHRAFLTHSFAAAEFLLRSGADLMQKDISGQTPIDYLKHNMEVKDTQGRTKLHRAFLTHSFAAAEILLRSGADLMQKDISGQTPIDYLKLNLEAKDIDGLTKLDYAIKNNCSKVADILRKLAQKDSSGMTLLQN